ncbi:MAG: hypothetical protein WAW09_12085 [Smithella sp.]|jgi:hypothetical protein
MLIDKSQSSIYVKLDSIDTPKGALAAWRYSQPDNNVWDTFLASAPSGHFYQTSMWAQVRMLDGWDNLVLCLILILYLS